MVSVNIGQTRRTLNYRIKGHQNHVENQEIRKPAIATVTYFYYNSKKGLFRIIITLYEGILYS